MVGQELSDGLRLSRILGGRGVGEGRHLRLGEIRGRQGFRQ